MLGTVPRHSIRSHLLSSTFSPVLRSTLSQRFNPSSGGDTKFSRSAWIEVSGNKSVCLIDSARCTTCLAPEGPRAPKVFFFQQLMSINNQNATRSVIGTLGNEEKYVFQQRVQWHDFSFSRATRCRMNYCGRNKVYMQASSWLARHSLRHRVATSHDYHVDLVEHSLDVLNLVTLPRLANTSGINNHTNPSAVRRDTRDIRCGREIRVA